MARLTSVILAQLINGISQQDPALRLPSQAEKQDNCVSSVVSGLGRRPGTENLAQISATPFGDAFVHTIFRDESERWIVIVTDGDLKVFDFEGNEATVNFPDGTTYLDLVAGVGPGLASGTFALTTIADTSFVVNKTVTVAMDIADTNTLKSTVQTFLKLPSSPADGDVHRITGDDLTDFLEYYVTRNGSIWNESRSAGDFSTLDATTMPHQLVRIADAEFDFKKIDWAQRDAGDDKTNDRPSFVGNTINDVFLYQNRFGILADENIVLSEIGEAKYFNFFRTTVQTFLDSDRIDIHAGHSQISILRHAIPFNRRLLVFAQRTQFELSSRGQLSTKTVSFTASTEFESSLTAKPVSVGDAVLFAVEKEEFTSILELFVSGVTDVNDANDITQHVPEYIPKDVHTLIASTTENYVVSLSRLEPNTLYINQFFFGAQDGLKTKVQNAWHRWVFAPGDNILNVDFDGSDLLLLVERADGVWLDKMSLAAGHVEDGLVYQVHGDRKTQLNGTFSAATGLTTWTLPYADPNIFHIVKSASWGVSRGQEILNLLHPTATTITAPGDFSLAPVIAAAEYESVYELSEQFLRNMDNLTLASARVFLRFFSFAFSETGFLSCEVTPKARPSRLKTMTSKTIGELGLLVGAVPLTSGDFRVGVLAKTDQVTITLKSASVLPFHVLNAEWKAVVRQRGDAPFG